MSQLPPGTTVLYKPRMEPIEQTQARCGFKREDAAKALALGWTKAEIEDFHTHLQFEMKTIDKIWDWGLVDSYGIRRYRGTHYDISTERFSTSKQHLTAVAYCDGSGTTMEKPAGIGVYIVHGNDKDLDRVFVAENIGLGTNNRAELCAIWRALRQFPGGYKELIIRSDSEYAIGALTQDWARNANGGLIRRIREDREGRKVTFEHVDGHAGIEGNEVADKLANIGRKLITAVSVYEG